MVQNSLGIINLKLYVTADFMLYTVHCVVCTYTQNCYLSCIRQLWGTTLAVFDTWEHVQLTSLCLETDLSTSDTTQEFHSKVITNQNMRIYVNIRTMLNIAVACEGFTITGSYLLCFFFIFIIFYLVFISFILQFHID